MALFCVSAKLKVSLLICVKVPDYFVIDVAILYILASFSRCFSTIYFAFSVKLMLCKNRTVGGDPRYSKVFV